MLDGKLDNMTKVILADHDCTINQAVTPDTAYTVDCAEGIMPVLLRNYLITGCAVSNKYIEAS